MENGTNKKPDVIEAMMKAVRAMRRRPFMPPPPPPCDMKGDHGEHHGPHGHHGHHCHHPGGMMGQGRALEEIGKRGSLTSGELAEALDIRPSSATELISKLCEAGLAEKSADENDKRVVRISLSEEGKKLCAQASERREKELEKVSACFTNEEAEQFCELCAKLAKHLGELAEKEKEEREKNGFVPGDFPPPPPGFMFDMGERRRRRTGEE